VDELKAEEITAYLRPNPQFTLGADGTQIAPHEGIWRPTSGTQVQPNVSYLHEREHKRELRLQSAQEGRRLAVAAPGPGAQHDFQLRSAFVQSWRRAVLELARADLEYYDKIIRSARRGSRTATWRRWTWTGLSCCGCSTRRN